ASHAGGPCGSGARARFVRDRLLQPFVFGCHENAAPESMATFVHLVNMPLLFTSSALVPARQMPDWLAALSRVNPLTLAVDASRDALLLGEFSSLGMALMLLTAIGIVLLAAAWTTAIGLRRQS